MSENKTLEQLAELLHRASSKIYEIKKHVDGKGANDHSDLPDNHVVCIGADAGLYGMENEKDYTPETRYRYAELPMAAAHFAIDRTQEEAGTSTNQNSHSTVTPYGTDAIPPFSILGWRGL
jgi:hypothetical protein